MAISDLAKLWTMRDLILLAYNLAWCFRRDLACSSVSQAILEACRFRRSGDELGERPPSHCLSGKPDTDSDQGSVQLSRRSLSSQPGTLPFNHISQVDSSSARRLFFQVKSSAISHISNTPLWTWGSGLSSAACSRSCCWRRIRS